MTDKKIPSQCTPTGCRFINRVLTGGFRGRYRCWVCGKLRPLR